MRTIIAATVVATKIERRSSSVCSRKRSRYSPRDQYRVRQRTTKLTVAVNGGEATPAALPPMTTAIAASSEHGRIDAGGAERPRHRRAQPRGAPPDLCGNGLRPYCV